MRLEQLEYLDAVVRLGSLRRASEHLHVSPPALSEALGKLERELGVHLLERRRSGARVSRQGRELLPRMAEVLDAVERLRAAAGDERSTARPVRTAVATSVSARVLTPALGALARDHPDVVVDVAAVGAAEVRAGVEDGALDLGLVDVLDGDDLPRGLRSGTVVRGRPEVVLPAGHPLARAQEVGPAALRTEPLVLMPDVDPMHRLVRRLLGDRLPDHHRTAGTAEVAALLVADGLGVTVLPDFAIGGHPLERAGLLVRRPVAGDSTTVRLVLLRRGAGPLPAPVRLLAQHLVDDELRG